MKHRWIGMIVAALMTASLFSGCATETMDAEHVHDEYCNHDEVEIPDPLLGKIIVDEVDLIDEEIIDDIEIPEAGASTAAPLAASSVPKQTANWGDAYDNIRAPHAFDPKPEDWSRINPDFPSELYEWAYNCGIDTLANGNRFFGRNVEIKWTATQKAELVQTAIGYWEAMWTADYRGDLDAQKKRMLYYFDPVSNVGDEGGRVTDEINITKDYQLVTTAYFITDDSLLYIPACGHATVRGRLFVNVSHATSEYQCDGVSVKLNTWYYMDVEAGFTHPVPHKTQTIKHEAGYYTRKHVWFFNNVTRATSADLAMLNTYLATRGIAPVENAQAETPAACEHKTLSKKTYYKSGEAYHPHNSYKLCIDCGEKVLTGKTVTSPKCTICIDPS